MCAALAVTFAAHEAGVIDLNAEIEAKDNALREKSERTGDDD